MSGVKVNLTTINRLSSLPRLSEMPLHLRWLTWEFQPHVIPHLTLGRMNGLLSRM